MMFCLQATLQGVNAVDALLNMSPNSPSLMLAKNGNSITRPSLMDCVEKARRWWLPDASRE